MYITQSLFSIPPLFAKSWKLTACVFSTPSLTCKGGSFEPLGTPSPTRLQITQLSVSIGAVKAKLIKRICGLSNFIAFIAMRLICLMYSNFPGCQFLRTESKLRESGKELLPSCLYVLHKPSQREISLSTMQSCYDVKWSAVALLTKPDRLLFFDVHSPHLSRCLKVE